MKRAGWQWRFIRLMRKCLWCLVAPSSRVHVALSTSTAALLVIYISLIVEQNICCCRRIWLKLGCCGKDFRKYYITLLKIYWSYFTYMSTYSFTSLTALCITPQVCLSQKQGSLTTSFTFANQRTWRRNPSLKWVIWTQLLTSWIFWVMISLKVRPQSWDQHPQYNVTYWLLSYQPLTHSCSRDIFFYFYS